MLKAKTGAQTCLPSFLITVQHLIRRQEHRRHFCTWDVRSERKYHKLKYKTQLSDALSATLQSAKVKDQQAKQRMKAYVDMRNRASPSEIASGDKVLLKQARQNKLSTLYDPRPFTVLERRGPSLFCSEEMDVGSCAMCRMSTSCTRTLVYGRKMIM